MQKKEEKEHYTYQILDTWDVYKGSPEEIEEFDSEQKALELAKKRVASGQSHELHIAKLLHTITPEKKEINVEVQSK